MPVKRAKPKAKSEADGLLYLYGISQAAGDKTAQVGIDGVGRVESIRCAGLVCWVTRVSKRDFGDALAANMENLDWLANASVRHQQVMSAIAAKASVIPARFGSVYVSEQSLAADVAGRKAQLLKALKRVAGADEWGVKVFAARRATAAVSAASGSDYLRKKASMLHANERLAPDEQVERLAVELGKTARASANTGKVSGGQRDLVWQASFLVPRSKRKQWEQVLGRFAQAWGEERRIECTGPWPPYSFVSES
jgi:Gas vesicle synthesis protein GvpL/GvpF